MSALMSPPTNLPKPVDDGACNDLPGKGVPNIFLPSTNDEKVNPSQLEGLTVIFCYPRMAPPSEEIPKEWDEIPGARGCTPQACSFRDLAKQLSEAGASNTFGLSTQDLLFMKEAKERLHLPYELLSDEDMSFVKQLDLPTFEYQGVTRVKRVTLAVQGGNVVKYWYPIFPSNTNAQQVLDWLKSRS